jgi:hypothetical protein
MKGPNASDQRNHFAPTPLCLTITGRRPFVADGRAHPAHLQGRQGSTQRRCCLRRRAHRGPGAEPAVAAAGASIPRPRFGG